MILLSGILLPIFVKLSMLTIVDGDVLCGSCHDVKSPDSCTVFEMCGRNEICFARAYIDHNDQHVYRLGCESKQICSSYQSTLLLIGRRGLNRDVRGDVRGDVKHDITDNVTRGIRGDIIGDIRDDVRYDVKRAFTAPCFECCSSPQCNTKACGGGHTGHTPVPWVAQISVHPTQRVSEIGWPSIHPPLDTTIAPLTTLKAHITDPTCYDLQTTCPYWQSTGECSRNNGYMKINCKKSCGLC